MTIVGSGNYSNYLNFATPEDGTVVSQIYNALVYYVYPSIHDTCRSWNC